MTPDEMIAAACALAAQRRARSERVIVAIDGCGGAGKSTLARGVQNSIANVSIVRTDDFFRPLNQFPRGTLAPAKAYELYLDWDRMRAEALVPVREGKTARYQRYDWATDALGEWVITGPNPIVIVEGVYSSRPELRELLDAIIFIDAPRGVRRRRMLARGHHDSDWMTPWMTAEDWYLEHIRPQDFADLILHSA
ncbi:MAG TPA: AAA family ATPase [Candidatus Binataceae bacterium]|nr:AAA family ATPase [Candidatus Binataceae bacterium]